MTTGRVPGSPSPGAGTPASTRRRTARRVAVVGAGPAGLFLARTIGLTRPGTVVDVYERNGPEGASGFGVSLSARVMHRIARADPQTHADIAEAAVPLAGLEVRLPGAVTRYNGFDVRAVSRHALLSVLRRRAEEVGARLHFHRDIAPDDLDADVVAVADGANSAHRTAAADAYGTHVRTGSARYIWLGTRAGFGGRTTFAFESTPYGPMAAHCYPYGDGMSTVVVETDETTWRNAGFADPSPEAGLNLLTEIFADHLDGHKLVSNRSRWGRFAVVRNARWSHGRTVLLGDAAHTAHFTVGSGTRMALEDALALATALHGHRDRDRAFAAYEKERRPSVVRTQDWADSSMRWWETYGRRLGMPPAQFGLHFLTRTPAMSYLGLRRRCAERVDEAEEVYHRRARTALRDGADGSGTYSGPDPGVDDGLNALASPLRLGPAVLPNRLAGVESAAGQGSAAFASVRPGLRLVREADPVGPPAPDSTVTGTLLTTPEDLGTRAGAGIVFVELTCPGGTDGSETGDVLVLQAAAFGGSGAHGVLLRAHTGDDRAWHSTLRHASRIRTETGLAVAVCVPDTWALGLTRTRDEDSWPTRIHVALVSGRIDLVAVLPPA